MKRLVGNKRFNPRCTLPEALSRGRAERWAMLLCGIAVLGACSAGAPPKQQDPQPLPADVKSPPRTPPQSGPGSAQTRPRAHSATAEPHPTAPASVAGASTAPISAAEIEGHLRFLADDALQGRGLGSSGLAVAAAYHEARFRSLGLHPAFGTGFRQPLVVRGSLPDPGAQLTLKRAGWSRRLRYLDDFVVVGHRKDAPPVVKGELVYGGYLIQAPGRHWDDIKGVDLRGKVLLVEVNEPGNHPGGIFEGEAMTYFGRWTYKYEMASKLGALGVLIVHDDKRAAYGWEVVRRSWAGEEFFLPQNAAKTLFQGWLQQSVVRQALTAAGRDYDALVAAAEKKTFRPTPLGLTVQVRQKPTFRQVEVENVAGIVRGRHPAHQGRSVIVSAHFDHLGRQRVDEGTHQARVAPDLTYNGAVDNSSASAALLALARRLAQQATDLPVDVVFLAATAEESGLLGSSYFVRNLPLDAASVLANINLEMTNIWGPTEDVYAIGAAQSSLDELCRQAAKELGLRYIPEQDRENGFFFRSDQLSFARAGIPAVWLHEGVTSRGPDPKHIQTMRRTYRQQHYHQPSDDVGHLETQWDLRGTAQIARWAEAVVWQLAAAKTMPAFDSTSAFSAADRRRRNR